MANTLGTTNGILIAQNALATLLAVLPFLKKITTDFSDQKALFGQTVITHIVTAAPAVDFDPAVGYVAQGRTQVDVPVTINKHKHHTYEIGVQEASSTHIDLVQRFALTAAYSIGQALVQDLCALVTAAAFPNATAIPLGAGGDGFDRKGVIKCGVALSKRKVQPFGRFMLLNPDYKGSIENDITVVGQLYTGARAIQTGSLPNVHGFGIDEYIELPDNGQNLAGFCGVPEGLVLATRIPDDPGEGNAVCDIHTVTDEDSGISLQVREWYNADQGKFKRTYTLMYGVAKGHPDTIQRIVTSAPAAAKAA